jgi:hypothetical protein
MTRFSNTSISLSVGFICKSAFYSSKGHSNDDVERYRTAKYEILYEVFAFFITIDLSIMMKAYPSNAAIRW